MSSGPAFSAARALTAMSATIDALNRNVNESSTTPARSPRRAGANRPTRRLTTGSCAASTQRMIASNAARIAVAAERPTSIEAC